MVNSDYNSPQAIIDNLHSAVIVIGENLQIICINPAAEMMFHISNNRAVKKNIRELIINEHEFFDRLERSLISGHPYTVYEHQLNTHHHDALDIDYSVSPIEYRDDGKYLLLEFFHLKVQQKFSHEESILNQYEASKSLLRGLAHEIKNPLGGIRGAAQLLERELEKSQDLVDNKQFTQIVINEADRLKNLLDRMVGPKDIPQKTDTNIHMVLEHVRSLVLAETPDLSLKVDYDPSIPELHADESMMVQVILNITRNAVKAISAMGDTGEIKFRTRTQRNCTIGPKTFPLVARVDISDNGAGVSSDIQEKIFMPMITGHADGTGLGLSIAQSLVQQHDGLIEFHSKPGKTVFTLLIPVSSSTTAGNGE